MRMQMLLLRTPNLKFSPQTKIFIFSKHFKKSTALRNPAQNSTSKEARIFTGINEISEEQVHTMS